MPELFAAQQELNDQEQAYVKSGREQIMKITTRISLLMSLMLATQIGMAAPATIQTRSKQSFQDRDGRQ